MVKQSFRALDLKSSVLSTYEIHGLRELSDAEAMWKPGPRPGTASVKAWNRFNSGPLHKVR